MKKTIITNIIILILVSISNFVNASTVSLSGDINEANNGDIVTITLDTGGEIVKAANFRIKYDKNLLEYVESNTTTANTTYEDGANFNYFDTKGTDKFEIKFKVIGNNGRTVITAEPLLFAKGIEEEDEMQLDGIQGEWEVKTVGYIEENHTDEKEKSKTGIIVAVIVIGVLIVSAVVYIFKKRKNK